LPIGTIRGGSELWFCDDAGTPKCTQTSDWSLVFSTRTNMQQMTPDGITNPSGDTYRFDLSSDAPTLSATTTGVHIWGCSNDTGNDGFYSIDAFDNGADWIELTNPNGGTDVTGCAVDVLNDDSTIANGNNIAISMLQVVGDELYIGFDNLVDGARLYAADSVMNGTVDAAGDFTEEGRITPTSACTNFSSPDGDVLGGYCFGFEFFSSALISKAGTTYLYVATGCKTESVDNGKCDTDPTVSTVAQPAIRVMRKKF